MVIGLTGRRVFVCVCVCLCVCYHDNSKSSASIFTKLGPYVKVVTISSWLNFGRPAPCLGLHTTTACVHCCCRWTRLIISCWTKWSNIRQRRVTSDSCSRSADRWPTRRRWAITDHCGGDSWYFHGSVYYNSGFSFNRAAHRARVASPPRVPR